jgi:aspartate-semialdehyde dehydrogenase
MKVAIVWATWAVGQKMLQVLDERWFPINKIIPVASEKSLWNTITFRGKQHTIVSFKEAISQQANLALFSAWWTISKEQAPFFAEVWTTVIDNSSAWRMDESKKLIVPEVNAHVLEKTDKIIANPNCSTIQMVVALNPLHQKYWIKRIVISTYQAVSGAWQKWINQLEKEEKEKAMENRYFQQ